MNEAARPGELTGRDLAVAAAAEVAARNPAGRPRRRVRPTDDPIRRRRGASTRCTVLDGDTRRDPLDPDRRGGGPPTGGELDGWAAAITHFRRLGLPSSTFGMDCAELLDHARALRRAGWQTWEITTVLDVDTVKRNAA